MDLLSVIRRWHGRDQLSIREISRRTGLSRHSIRKYLASGVTEPKYPTRRNASKLDPYMDKLSTWLKRESQRSRKRRRSLKQLHLDLVALGFDGSYDQDGVLRTFKQVVHQFVFAGLPENCAAFGYRLDLGEYRTCRQQ